MVRIGMVGCGKISGRNIRQMKEAKAEVVALADLSLEARTFRAKEHNVEKTFETLTEMIKGVEIDGVMISAPNALHAPLAIEALEAGLHTLVEKPMATNREDAGRMVTAANKANKVLMVGTNQRFDPSVQYVARLHQEGRIGKVYHARAKCIRACGIPMRSAGSFVNPKLSGGGVTLDLGVHALDRTWFMLGKPKPISVSAQVYDAFIRPQEDGSVATGSDAIVEDFTTAFFRFEGGMTMALEVSWAANRGDEGLMVILQGNKAGAVLEGIRPGKVTLYSQGEEEIVSEPVEALEMKDYPTVPMGFIKAITDGVDSGSNGSDGLIVQSMLDGIYESARAGKEVPVEVPNV